MDLLRMHRIPNLLFLACAAVLLLFVAPARAATFQVSPVNVSLNAAAPSAVVAIRNMGEETVRVQVSVFGWKQTKAGEVDLQPTQDLVFFPSILTIPPHDARNVRVSPAPGQPLAVNVEKTYRMIVEELLPPAKATLPVVGLRVLTRMSIPVFIQPAKGRALPQVEGLSVRTTEAVFDMTNKGTLHFMARTVRAFVTAKDGRRIFETSMDGWYVLPQGVRSYVIPLPATACSTGGRLTIEVETDHGNATQTVGSPACS